MPTLFRYLVFAAILTGLAYGAMFGLVFYVEPTPREIVVKVPAEKFDLNQF